MSDGVPLAVAAARKALQEAHVAPSQVTHMVSTTCTDSANPGYDHFVAQELGLSYNVEKVLLHGVGCSGGLAALRTAANLCLGHSCRGLPARILVVALEITTTLVRSELESINALNQTRIGVTLFSDCAGVLVLSNNFTSPSHPPPSPPIYSLLTWYHTTIPSTESDLGFDIDPTGWKVVLSPAVPRLTQSALLPAFHSLLPDHLLSTLPENYRSPADFDWAMHPGGSTILTGAEQVLGITSLHMRASYDTYIRHGNSSSATMMSVLDRLREKDMDELAPPCGSDSSGTGRGGFNDGKDRGASKGKPREYIIGCAFGPGISVEMCLLKRHFAGPRRVNSTPGMETPPETESELSLEGSDSDSKSDRDDEMTGKHGSPDSAKPQQKNNEGFISEALESPEVD